MLCKINLLVDGVGNPLEAVLSLHNTFLFHISHCHLSSIPLPPTLFPHCYKVSSCFLWFLCFLLCSIVIYLTFCLVILFPSYHSLVNFISETGGCNLLSFILTPRTSKPTVHHLSSLIFQTGELTTTNFVFIFLQPRPFLWMLLNC